MEGNSQKIIIVVLLLFGVAFALLGYLAFSGVDIEDFFSTSPLSLFQDEATATPVDEMAQLPPGSNSQSTTPTRTRVSNTPTTTPTSKPTLTPTSTPTPTPTATPTPVPDMPPGMACFGTIGSGMSCLDDTGWRSFTQGAGTLGGDNVHDVVFCPDGRLLAVHTFGVGAFNGQVWKEYSKGWGSSSPEALACAPNGDIWVAHFEGASRFDGKEWKTYNSRLFESDGAVTGLVEDIAVAPDGLVWVVTSSNVASFDGSRWRVYVDKDFGGIYFFDAIALDAAGNPWVAHTNGVLTLEDGKTWVNYVNEKLLTVESIAVDLSGRIWVGTFGRGLFVYEDGGWITYVTGNSPLVHDRVYDVFIDSRQRAWVATEFGINVVAGQDWFSYRMDNADLVDNSFRAVTVSEGGPATLLEPVEKASGSLSGRAVFENGSPAAGALVEICAKRLNLYIFDAHPCLDQPLQQSVEVGANGDFAFENLTPAWYNITVYNGDTWSILPAANGISALRSQVLPGENSYIGELVVK